MKLSQQTQENPALYTLLMVSAAYIASQMIADIASLKIVTIAGISVDGGTLIYPFTFTLRDLVHKQAGAKAARRVIFSAAGINLVMAGTFALVASLPGDPAVGPQAEFAAVLSPAWRIVMASIVAEVVSELLDTSVYALWVKRFKSKHQWGRVLSSNAVSVPIDSVIFSLIAFAGDLHMSVIADIILMNILVKFGVTLLSIPMIYAVGESDATAKE